MTSVFSARRRAEEFAALVDGTLGTEARPELTELAGVATLLRVQDAPTLRAEYAADLRARLMAEAQTALSSPNANLVLPARPRGRREHRLVAAATAVVFIGGTAGMATAAEHALPGEALYPVKRAIEHAQAGLSTSNAGRGRDLLTQASDRLSEATSLLAADTPASLAQVPPTIDDFTAQAQQGSGLMMSSFQENRDPGTIVTVRRFAAASLASLRQMARTAPADSQDELASAAVALSNIDQQARDLCADCAPGLGDLAVPPTFRAAAEADRALRQVQGAHLDNSHPVAVDRQALSDVSPAGPVGDATDPSPAAPQNPVSPAPGLQVPSLPKVDKQVKKSANDTGDALGSSVNKVGDGLGGAVETLLPDPSSTSLP
jgi:hypothetical protein